MIIGITVGELVDKGVWLNYCELTGTNEWSINEGLIDSDEVLNLSEQHAIQLGLIPNEDWRHGL